MNTSILAFNALQQAVPEVRLTAFHAAFNGFCELEFELPEEIEAFFRSFLVTAKEHTDGTECNIRLSGKEKICVGLVLPDRTYRIMPLPPSKAYRLEDPPRNVKKHRKVIHDAVGHEKVVYVREDDDSIRGG